ncbi:MAG: tRNA epoxyqueuosine(34) reductase QueG [Candidatus Latescibacteria bacterium]|nr:tRNA epoxyqueuosine(34) reductase QueG [Candidatus Latescibacterota bacterium]
MILTEKVKEIARCIGFDLVGVAPAQTPEHWGFYQQWLASGYAGEMGYLGRNLERRADPCEIVPNAKSVLCLGMNYLPKTRDVVDGAPRGMFAKYALGDDYHDLIKARLFDLLAEIQKLEPLADGRVYVDTGPVLERDVAARAGLGWFGKHTGLIHKRKGSWFFLAEIILNIELTPDAPQMDHCGTCTRCIDACPTKAIVEPYVVDSRLCISYLTIELRGSIPRNLRPKIGNWVYGCDICQDVCPWNQKHSQPTDEPAFQPRSELDAPKLGDLLLMDQAKFSATFKGSPVKRTKRRGLLRNAAVALGNIGSVADVPVLGQCLCDHEILVREHAAWALGQVGGDEAVEILQAALEDETESDVLNEIRLAIETIQTKKG